MGRETFLVSQDSHSENRSAADARAFLTTRWSRVVLAGDADHPEAHAAFSSLCEDYWRPLYHFARQNGRAPADAQDATQGFIASLMQSGGIARADPQRGRFRSFLLASFRNYLANEHRRETAQKRGGQMPMLSLGEVPETEFLERTMDTMTPELLYERSWAHALIERVMARLEAEYDEAGRRALYETMQPYLSGAVGRPGYARLGEQIGMSESAITAAVHRMRRRYGELLREEVGATVATPEEVEDELRHLIRIISTTPSGPGSV
jgi:RNA polymerase sigma-70 factor (ECF subfamily)